MGFSRQEYWSGWPCPPPGNLPDPGIELVSLMSPALTGVFSTTVPSGKLYIGATPRNMSLKVRNAETAVNWAGWQISGVDRTVLGRVGCGVGWASSPQEQTYSIQCVWGHRPVEALLERGSGRSWEQVLSTRQGGPMCPLRCCHPWGGDIPSVWPHELRFLDFLETEALVKEQAHRGLCCALPRG